MRLFKADPQRRIRLEGLAEPVPRPVDIDQAQTGFPLLRTLRVYHFPEGSRIEGHAEEDEVFIVVLAGEIALELRTSQQPGQSVRLRAPSGSAPQACVAFLPPHGGYVLTAVSAAEVAYIRATPRAARPLAVFPAGARSAPGEGRVLEVLDHAERLRLALISGPPDAKAGALPPFGTGSAPGGALLHLSRAPSGGPLTIRSEDGHESVLETGDTVALGARERVQLRMPAGEDMLALVTWAE